ncbi:TIGR02757 family protein [bacterium]|nr:TIGR02757 family protein [bacterium]
MPAVLNNELKILLDKLVETYETMDFIKDDPIQFPHRFSKKEDVEIAGFIASLFAFGKRELFIKKLNQFFEIAQEKPLDYIIKGDFSEIIAQNFNYRFIKPDDMVEMLRILNLLYKKDGGLENLFAKGYELTLETQSKQDLFKYVTDYFYSRASQNAGAGFYFMFPNPYKGGAMKRMCMFLRWMVRKSDVDLGIWNFMPPSELLIPLDVHVGRISKELGILNRKANDFKSVLEITEKLREFCPQDPIKYDFAMFGYGVNR